MSCDSRDLFIVRLACSNYTSAYESSLNFIDLARLKANNGNQKYNMPRQTSLTKYNLIYMMPGLLFFVWECKTKDIRKIYIIICITSELLVIDKLRSELPF
jgi:hypothetical protein